MNAQRKDRYRPAVSKLPESESGRTYGWIIAGLVSDWNQLTAGRAPGPLAAFAPPACARAAAALRRAPYWDTDQPRVSRPALHARLITKRLLSYILYKNWVLSLLLLTKINNIN